MIKEPRKQVVENCKKLTMREYVRGKFHERRMSLSWFVKRINPEYD
jgi:hypothetical protein